MEKSKLTEKQTQNQEQNVKKEKKLKYIHIVIIVLGILFISLPIFHQNLWFDESYSVGMANKSFADIWTIGSNDVHPVLYYWVLHIAYLLFGSNIYVYRILSMLPIAILGILGYTHIKKDFGEKVGLLFSFFVFFLPITSVYSGEIRMYTWAMLLVSLMAIYAYRIYKNSLQPQEKLTETEIEKTKAQNNQLEKENRKIFKPQGFYKNWVLFAIFSLTASYTHYYGLATAGIINLALFIYFVVKQIKIQEKEFTEDKKEEKQLEYQNITEKNKLNKLNLKCFIVSAVVQIALYLPWLIYLLTQFQAVSKGFWIQRPSVELWLQILTFQFTGNLDVTFLKQELALAFSIILLVYTIGAMIYAIIKHRKKHLPEQDHTKLKNTKETYPENVTRNMAENTNKPGLFAIGIYAIVVICIFIISLKVPVLYARYFLNLTGIFIFFMSFFMIKGGKKVLTVLICILTLITAIFVNYQVSTMNYGPTNSKPLAYVKQDLQQDDLILFGNTGNGFVLSMQLVDIANCFFDGDYWNVEPAYQAFGKDMKTIKTLEGLDDYQGRIWIIDGDNYNIYKEMKERYKENVTLIKQDHFATEYHNYQYYISLVEKK